MKQMYTSLVLTVLAATVATGLIAGIQMWPWICIYWVCVTLKNAQDAVHARHTQCPRK